MWNYALLIDGRVYYFTAAAPGAGDLAKLAGHLLRAELDTTSMRSIAEALSAEGVSIH